MALARSTRAAVFVALLGSAAFGCGGSGGASGDANASASGSDSADMVDPSGTTLTAEEIAAGAAWDDAGTQENGELGESDDDGAATDDAPGDDDDALDDFDALPLADADDAGALPVTVTVDDAGSDLLMTGALVTSTGALLCTPPGTVRSAACYAHGQYKGQIRVISMDSKVVEVGVACAVLKGKALAKNAGRTLTVNSGWRSVASQRVLYQKYKAGRGPVAAPPGTSHHNCGHAIDYAGSALGSGWLKANSTRFGFSFIPIKGETWHFEDWTVGPGGVK